MKQIIEKKADYILQVKGNQEILENEIAEYFEKEIFPRKKKEYVTLNASGRKKVQVFVNFL